MGQRANLVLIEDGKTTVHYNHWCANRLDKELFFGPSQAKRFIAAQEEVGDDGWLDEVWAEGGAALDMDARRLVWYGGEDVLYEIPIRRVLLEMMSDIWRGFKLEWAFEGIASIADVAGYPRSKVLAKEKPEDDPIRFFGESEKSFGIQPASVRWEDNRVLIYPHSARSTFVTLLKGPKIIEELRKARGLSRYCAGRGREDLSTPTGGFHLDIKTRTFTFWQAQEQANAVDLLTEKWPGWTVCWQRDRFESQTELTQGELTIAVEDLKVLVDRVRTIVLHESKPVDPDGVIKTLTDNGNIVTNINPMIGFDTHVELDSHVRTAIADWAVHQFLARRNAV